MRRTIIVLLALAGLMACERAPAGPAPAKVGGLEERRHRLDGTEPPILRSRSAQGYDRLTLQVTVDEAGRVTKAVATDGPADVRKTAVAAALGWRYRPFVIGGRAQPVSFTVYLPYYPPQVIPTRHVAFPAGDLSTVHIRLMRDACFGRCPAYTVEIAGDGSVTYRGVAFVAILGEHHAHIPPAAVAALIEQFRAADFFSLQDKYAAQITDNPTYQVGIDIGGRSKSVTDYIGLSVGMPDAVARLEDAIDRVAGTVRWVRGEDDVMTALRAEPWDFTSKDAARSLIWNAGEGSESLARALLDAGAPLDPAGDLFMGRSALEAALAVDRLPLAKTLMAHGALQRGGPDAAERALIAAARSGRADVVAEMLAPHPDVNRMIDSQCALIAAVGAHRYRGMFDRESSAEATRLLLQAGANPNLQGVEGETALHLAGDAETVRLLVKAGARLETRDQMGRTPLLAVIDEDAAIALVDAGADVHAQSGGSDIAAEARQSNWKKLSARLSRSGR